MERLPWAPAGGVTQAEKLGRNGVGETTLAICPQMVEVSQFVLKIRIFHFLYPFRFLILKRSKTFFYRIFKVVDNFVQAEMVEVDVMGAAVRTSPVVEDQPAVFFNGEKTHPVPW